MAVTKSQLAVWVLIAVSGVLGTVALSQVKIADVRPAPALSAATVVSKPPAVSLPILPGIPLASTSEAEAQQETISEFPFPMEFPAEDEEPSNLAAASPASDLAEVPSEAIPAIDVAEDPAMSAFEDDSLSELPTVRQLKALSTTDEPPIPMPSRPLIAQPVKAVPLSEVRTLYVVAEMLNVRASPSTSGQVLQKVPLGFEVPAQQAANDWIGFVMHDGTIGWIRTDYLSETKPAPTTAAVSSPIRRAEPLNLM